MRNRSGQGAVETALVLPLLLLFILAILEFGQAWRLKQEVTGAAREGARRAVVQNPVMTKDSVQAVIRRTLGRAGVDTGNMEIAFDSINPPTGHWRDPGHMQTVSVSLQFKFGFFGPIFQAAFGDDEITLSSVVTMRNE
jgi:hypothetical protein